MGPNCYDDNMERGDQFSNSIIKREGVHHLHLSEEIYIKCKGSNNYKKKKIKI